MFNNHNGWGNFLHQPQPQNQEPLLSDFAAVVTPSTHVHLWSQNLNGIMPELLHLTNYINL